MKKTFVFTSLLWLLSLPSHGLAETTAIHLNFPEKIQAITVNISPEQSKALGWMPGKSIQIQIAVSHKDGTQERILDQNGRSEWAVLLGENGEGVVSIIPDSGIFSGQLLVFANGEKLDSSVLPRSGTAGRTVEKIYEYRFPDGAGIRVHYTDQALELAGGETHFPREVLDAAVSAYQTITQFEGFDTPRYAFANADKNYAYDPDKTIDIYLGNDAEDERFHKDGFDQVSFRDAPCFDTLKRGNNQYDAVILLPANYQEFIKQWEKLNPSPLGTRNVNIDIRGTLTHEMLHAILFYYNKNLKRDDRSTSFKELDWYVEGLARYFETFAGARHDFFSQGFRQVMPDKIRFSRGGSNFFMRYPDQAFTGLRYENALFWRYVDVHFGMGTIERLSREFRGADPRNLRPILEKVTAMDFRELLKKYALSILFKEFDLKEDQGFLADVAATKLTYHDKALFIRGASGQELYLGPASKTDWVGQWGSLAANFGEPGVAGDSTNEADVSGWATDYHEIIFPTDDEKRPWIGVYHKEGLAGLDAQFILITKGGSRIFRGADNIAPGQGRGIDLERALKESGLAPSDLEKVHILITNADANAICTYEIHTR